MDALFMLMFLIAGPQAEEQSNDQQRHFLLLEAEKFSTLALAFTDSPGEQRAKAAEELFQFLYKYSHVIYAEALYKTMKEKNLFVDLKVEKLLQERLDYLKQRVVSFHADVSKEYHPQKFCGMCAVSFYLGFRTSTMNKLEAENMKRPEDQEIVGLLGLFKGMIELEQAALDELVEELQNETLISEKKKTYFKMFYLQIYRDPEAWNQLHDQEYLNEGKVVQAFKESLTLFNIIMKQKESVYVL